LIERFDDFAKSLSYSINTCINLRPDFVLFTGDLFEHAKPQAPELRQVVIILEKLKQARIPLILSQGNHDVSYSRARRYGGDILEFLSDLNMGMRYVQDEITYFKVGEEKIALILGVNYYGKRTNRILNQLLTKYSDEINDFNGLKILMLHAFVQGMPGVADVKRNTIGKSFDYVAVGHLHERWENSEYNIYCPGSTEHTSSSEWKQPKRGMYDVRFVNKGSDNWVSQIEYVNIETRPKHIFKHEFKSLSVPEIRDEAENFLIKNDIEGAILRFVFSGNYEGKEHPFINLDHYRHVPKKALHTIIVSKFLEIEKQQETRTILSKREAYQELLTHDFETPSENVDEYISLIEDSLNIIEGSNSITDQEKLLDKRYSRFSKGFLAKFAVKEEG
jgi:DNA repair exonuclease SbcCD nuclease subunit